MNMYEQLPEKEYARQLISAAIDGELSEQQEQEFHALLRRYPDVADEYSEYKKIKEVTMGLKFSEPSPEIVKEIIGDAEMPWWVKGAVFAAAAGIVILLFSVIREKLFLHKSERYKEIIR
jgi:anti-sigma factor RsiW